MPGELLPDDLVAVGDLVHDALAPTTDRDWALPAGSLDWTIRETLEHASGATAAYAIHLAGKATAFHGFRIRARSDTPSTEVLGMVRLSAQLLATVAAGASDDVRAYHPSGMADRTGF